MKWIVFTDLDGTLLNQDDYSCEAARPVVERIQREGIPLIIASSKTRAEIEVIQEELAFKTPFIVENGGGIYFPGGYRGIPFKPGAEREPYFVIRLGLAYGKIREFVARVRQRIPLHGFGDMTVDEVARLTDLPPEKARLAKEREFSEPFLLDEAERISELTALAEESGLSITRGGRFYHLFRRGQDKGTAARFVKEIFRRTWNDEIRTVGLGDSLNDLPLLMAVDCPVLIPSPGGRNLAISLPGLVRAREQGSLGWKQSVEEILGWAGTFDSKITENGRNVQGGGRTGDGPGGKEIP